MQKEQSTNILVLAEGQTYVGGSVARIKPVKIVQNSKPMPKGFGQSPQRNVQSN